MLVPVPMRRILSGGLCLSQIFFFHIPKMTQFRYFYNVFPRHFFASEISVTEIKSDIRSHVLASTSLRCTIQFLPRIVLNYILSTRSTRPTAQKCGNNFYRSTIPQYASTITMPLHFLTPRSALHRRHVRETNFLRATGHLIERKTAIRREREKETTNYF